MSEQDPVVQEIDVHINHALSKLILAQYPLRPTYKTYQKALRKNMKFKPIKNEMELDMCIPINNSSKEQTQKLTVRQKPIIKPNSAVGLLKGHNLYLTPLESIVKLTPSFDHIDQLAAEDAKLNEQVEVTIPEIKTVTKKFLSQKLKPAAPKKKEMWTPCDYRPSDHPYTSGQKRSMMNKTCGKGVKGCEFNKETYLNLLIPDEIDVVYTPPPLPCTVTGFGDLKKLCPAKQIQTILKNAKVISFKEISAFLPHVPSALLLTELENSGYLIQGHWVVNSKLMYPDDTKSPLTGVPADVMQKHRDFIMWAFSSYPLIKRENLMKIMKIPPEEVLDILKQVSYMKPYNGWKFKKDYDPVFDTTFQDIMLTQKKKWDDIIQRLYRSLHLKEHKENPVLQIRAELESNTPDTPLISDYKSNEIIQKLSLQNVLDAATLAEITVCLQQCIREASCFRDDVINVLMKYVPHEYCSQLLYEIGEEIGLVAYGVVDEKGSTKPVISFKQPGCLSDKFRMALLKLFSSEYRVTKSVMKESLQRELDCNFTSKAYQLLTANMCINVGQSKSGPWILKINEIIDI